MRIEVKDKVRIPQRPILLICVLGYWLIACALFSEGNREVDFNAQTFSFDHTTQVWAYTPVKVVLRNINTFTHKYTINSETTDYHTTPMPSVLSSIIAKGTPVVSGAQAERAANAYPEKASKDLEKDYNTWKELSNDIGSLDNVFSQILALMNGDDPSSLPPKQNTNIGVRKSVAEKIQPGGSADETQNMKDYLSIKEDDSLNQQNIETAFNSAKPDINNEATTIRTFYDYYDEYTQIISKWKSDYDFYKKGLGTNADLYASDNERISTFDSSFQPKYAKDSGKYDGSYIKNIYVSVLDPEVVPLIIEKDLGPTMTDSLSVSVKIERIAPIQVSTDSSSEVLGGALTSNLVSNTYSTTVKTYFRLVLDYSLGLGVPSYDQQNYYIDKSGIVRAGTSDKVNIGAAALAQLYFTPWLIEGAVGIPMPGLCFGIIQGIETGQTNYVAGVSGILYLGQRIHLSYSYGASWGQITDLNGDVVGSPAIGSQVNTAKYIGTGTFYSFTASYAF